MYNGKRRLAERPLIKIMDTHLVTKTRNMDEKEINEEEEREEEANKFLYGIALNWKEGR